MTELPEGTAAHRADAARFAVFRAAVLTVTDSRIRETDVSGDRLQQGLAAAGHPVVARELLPNDEARVRAFVADWIARDDIDVIVITGGTGLGGSPAAREGDSRLRRALPTAGLSGTGRDRRDALARDRGERTRQTHHLPPRFRGGGRPRAGATHPPGGGAPPSGDPALARSLTLAVRRARVAHRARRPAHASSSDQVTAMSSRSESRTEQYFVTASSIARSACTRSIPAPVMV